MRHSLSAAALAAIIVLCTLLPFFPGRHDGLAVPLSSMAQTAGAAGLVLVPVGALWIAARRSRRLAGNQYAFALAALIASSLVWAMVSLVAAIQSGFALGLAAVALWGLVARKGWRGAQALRGAEPRSPTARTLPFYLVIVPAVVALLQTALVGPAVAFSRDLAIRNSAPLIAAIERYRAAHGRYPPSLLTVNPDYRPGVIGVGAYHYEPSGAAYNLFFEQFTDRLGAREFVMYNPRGEHVMTSHAVDLLELTPQQLELERRRGYFALQDAPHPHWKYFWFD
jgi:hypothetical protein